MRSPHLNPPPPLTPCPLPKGVPKVGNPLSGKPDVELTQGALNDAHTFDLARAAVEAGSMTAVAIEVGYSRTAISLYLSGKYGAGVEKLEAAIRARYDRYPCPHTGREISGPECGRRATAPRPFGGRAKEANWLACQSCEHKPQGAKP